MILILGLGIIGSRSADQILAAGFALKTWNRTPPNNRPDYVSDPCAAAAEASVIVSYLRDEVAVREVFERIRPSIHAGQTFINHSTVDPTTTNWLAQQCQRLDCGFLDAPFTGSRDAAAEGNLSYYVAGPSQLLEQHRQLLEATSKNILYLGEAPAATIVKITTNLVTASAIQALTEALEISRRHGVDPRAWHEAAKINGCYAGVHAMKIPSLIENDFTPHFSAENMAKDTLYASQLADAVGIRADGNLNTWTRLFEAEMRDASEDFSATIRQHQSNDLDLEEQIETSCARIRVTGKDAQRYLNGQISNDIALTEHGKRINACLLNAKGQLEAFIQIHREGEDFIVEGPYDSQEDILQRLSKYLIADEVELINESEEDFAFSLQPHETSRILNGIPKWPNELFEGILPPEAGLEQTAISYTKGCYTGQEVISRMKRAGKTNRQLIKLSLDKPLVPTNSKLMIGELEAGWITSVASHVSHGEIALGYRFRKFEEVQEFEVASPYSAKIIAKATLR